MSILLAIKLACAATPDKRGVKGGKKDVCGKRKRRRMKGGKNNSKSPAILVLPLPPPPHTTTYLGSYPPGQNHIVVFVQFSSALPTHTPTLAPSPPPSWHAETPLPVLPTTGRAPPPSTFPPPPTPVTHQQHRMLHCRRRQKNPPLVSSCGLPRVCAFSLLRGEERHQDYPTSQQNPLSTPPHPTPPPLLFFSVSQTCNPTPTAPPHRSSPPPTPPPPHTPTLRSVIRCILA